jgi:(2R)-3-sulfolactate dehydrogenase (NADP+)
MSEIVTLSIQEAEDLCFAAARRVGASEAAARSIARATAAAEADGQPMVGVAHLFDYLDGFREGRIARDVTPILTRPLPAIIRSDAGGGLAHLGFDLAFDDLVAAAQAIGLAIFAQRNAFTCGSLGYFVDRLAERGLVAIAATNGPAYVAGSGGTKPVYCTNPLAMAAPGPDGAALLIDQSSSATTFVNIRGAAERGEAIPPGWALGPDGKPTSDPAQALRGALLAFGGERGANVALMVEVLAAGLTGANWSVDAPPLTTGSESPGTGLFLIAISPETFAPGFAARIGAHMQRLANEFGVHVPGRAKRKRRQRAAERGLAIPALLVTRLKGEP